MVSPILSLVVKVIITIVIGRKEGIMVEQEDHREFFSLLLRRSEVLTASPFIDQIIILVIFVIKKVIGFKNVQRKQLEMLNEALNELITDLTLSNLFNVSSFLASNCRCTDSRICFNF